MQNVATINRTCRNHRVVALAKSTSGNRPKMSHEAKIATVMLGSTARQIGHAVLLSIGATLLTLVATLLFALLLHQVFGQTVNQVLLAYAPGGLAEMSLIALAMGAEVDYVALHHIVRITIIVLLAPFVFRLVSKYWRPPSD